MNTAAHNNTPTNSHAALDASNPPVGTWRTRACGVVAAVCVPALVLGSLLDLFDHTAHTYSQAAVELPTVVVVAPRTTVVAQADNHMLKCRT